MYDIFLLCRNMYSVLAMYVQSSSISIIFAIKASLCAVFAHMCTHLFLWFVYIVDVANLATEYLVPVHTTGNYSNYNCKLM